MATMTIIKDLRGKEYKQTANGTCYHIETSDEVINVLENAIATNERIRVFYGDKETGRDWCEEYDTIGTIGRSTGSIKIPLLIKRIDSTGGGSLLTHCIVKVTQNKREVYKHPEYHIGELAKKFPMPHKEYKFGVLRDGDNIANFKTAWQTENYIKFLKGINNNK